jgi:hypothetical protein
MLLPPLPPQLLLSLLPPLLLKANGDSDPQTWVTLPLPPDASVAWRGGVGAVDSMSDAHGDFDPC